MLEKTPLLGGFCKHIPSVDLGHLINKSAHRELRMPQQTFSNWHNSTTCLQDVRKLTHLSGPPFPSPPLLLSHTCFCSLRRQAFAKLAPNSQLSHHSLLNSEIIGTVPIILLGCLLGSFLFSWCLANSSENLSCPENKNGSNRKTEFDLLTIRHIFMGNTLSNLTQKFRTFGDYTGTTPTSSAWWNHNDRHFLCVLGQELLQPLLSSGSVCCALRFGGKRGLKCFSYISALEILSFKGLNWPASPGSWIRKSTYTY